VGPSCNRKGKNGSRGKKNGKGGGWGHFQITLRKGPWVVGKTMRGSQENKDYSNEYIEKK